MASVFIVAPNTTNMDFPVAPTILSFVLMKTWQCLKDTPNSQKNAYFIKYIPSQAALQEIASTTSITFAPGLFEILQAATPPTIENFKSFLTENLLCWAIYILILEKPGCTPRLYVGSGTDVNRGVKNRFAEYDTLRNLPSHVEKAIDEGYEIAHKILLCWTPFPPASMVPKLRLLFVALEATFSYMLWAMKTLSKDYGVAHMCLWDRTHLEYHG